MLDMKIDDIRFDEAKLYLTVEMSDAECYRTNDHPHLPETLFELVPSIRHHRCENDEALTFETEAQDTEIPHLFEHLVIELQLTATGGSLSGETSWDWTRDPQGRFHVAVDYRDRELAIGAAQLAARIIEAIDARRLDSIDLNREMVRLRRLAESKRLPPA